MISYSTILQQLEKQLAEAKNAATDQHMRESLTAVRALCDVVLALPVNDTKIQQKPLVLEPQQVVYTEKIEEDGANGDSIFDF